MKTRCVVISLAIHAVFFSCLVVNKIRFPENSAPTYFVKFVDSSAHNRGKVSCQKTAEEKTVKHSINKRKKTITGTPSCGRKCEARGSVVAVDRCICPIIKDMIPSKHNKKPLYPEKARIAGIVGVVQLLVTVNGSGEVVAIKIISSPSSDLSKSAIKSVRRWKFSRVTNDDKTVIIPIEFKLT